MALEGELFKQWSSLIKEFEMVSDISVPRYYVLLDWKVVSQQLHGFYDESGRAYAAVVYLHHTECQNGHVGICVVCSKTRVAFLKEQTILRLELLGATILSRLLSTVRKES